MQNYENKKLLINTHLNELLDFAAISNLDKPATMKQLIVQENVRTHLKVLQTLQLLIDKLLIHLLKNRMDFNIQKEETNKDKENRPA